MTVTMNPEGEYGRVWDKYSYQSAGKVLPESCGGCVFRPLCAGVPKAYARKYGTSELRPVTLQDALGLRRETRRFLQTGERPGRPAQERHLPGSMRGVMGRLAALARSGGFHGWSFSRSLALPGQGLAAVRMARGGDHFDLRFQADPARIELLPGPGCPPGELREPGEAILRFLGVRGEAG